MQSTRAQLQQHYQNLSDEAIEQLILYEAKDLTLEAQNVLEDEARRRSLTYNLTETIQTQVQGVSEKELQTLTALVSQLPCPVCNKDMVNLNATKIAIAQSFLIFTGYKESFIIGCAECLLIRAQEARKKTLLYGWWAVPWGPIKTLKALAVNDIAIDSKQYEKPTREFIEFVRSNAPAIKAKMKTLKSIDELHTDL